ncbi:MAG: HD domain-containing protein [Patescibacteria group bacterium]|jgi:poly(A) polymerase/tRNA nucleotidyltransferase (CCA-adding enzyme)|nr:HD domain-containing protein [Patescibacteria group bacterium]
MHIPDYILDILKRIQSAGFSVELVGGCVRDLLLQKEAKDWDLTTSARPEEILKLFPEAKYENEFGTVLIPVKLDEVLISVIEITTYRSENKYSDFRHPDEIKFEIELDKDLERRDFTINAMALALSDEGEIRIDDKQFKLIDLFGGQKDLKKKVIRAVGEPVDRFKEDALRMMRAIRFSAQLDFELEPKTERAIVKLAGSIKFVAKERIKDELIKILSSDRPFDGILALHNTKLLQYIIPELEQGVGVKQNHHHIYPVFKHNLLSLKYCPSPEWPVRLAALLHDVAKPKSKRIINGQATFYNHEYLGAKMVDKIMTRLKFKNEDRERVVNLVKNHMFYYNVGEVTAASVRRLISKVGRDNLQDLIYLRVADRLGSGTPKAMPYKLRHLQYMMEKVQHDPVSVKMLAVNGHDLMSILEVEAGPRLGAILDVLLAQVLENPNLNTKEILLEQAKLLLSMNLEDLRSKARLLIEETREDEDHNLQRKFKV